MSELIVENIIRLATDTATFQLSPADGQPLHYKAGQFITLIFDHHNEELRRSYSISSSPDEPLLSITVKRVPNGELSRFMLTHTKPGDRWNVAEPTGKFVLDGNEDKDLSFFAAGSGITPIFAQLKYLLHRPGQNKLTLIYSNRNANGILFKDELQTMEKQHPDRLKVIHFLSDEARRLNNYHIEQLLGPFANNLSDMAFYLCGPFDYMRMVRLSLTYMGVAAEQIRKENFVVDTVAVSSFLPAFAPHKVQIIYKGETYNITAGENQSILQAALQNKINIPYSCRVGICSACSAICSSGKVQMTANEVITPADEAKGWVLTCTGYALDDDVVIRYE